MGNRIRYTEEFK